MAISKGSMTKKEYLEWRTKMIELVKETPRQQVDVWLEALDASTDSSLSNQVLREIFDIFERYEEFADDEPIFGERKMALKRVLTMMTEVEKSRGKVKKALEAYRDLLEKPLDLNTAPR